jgi:DNA-binding transcriptional LysR family regulator
MNISLRQLKAFLGVAESSNFTKTAQRLHLSQAGLSATIRELESQLQSRLFDRTTRAVVLTEAGREFLPTATLIEREMSQAAERLKDMSRQEVATLRVGFTPLMSSNVVPEALRRFLAATPAVQVELVDGSPQEIQQLVESGGLDAAFGAFFSKVSGIRRQALIPSRLLAVYAKTASPATLPPDVPWTSLADEPLICLTQESPVQQLVEAQLFKQKINPGKRLTVSHLETAIAMAEKGFGTAIIPSFSAAACSRYAVRCRTLAPVVEFDYYYTTKAGTAASPYLVSFARFFAAVAAELATSSETKPATKATAPRAKRAPGILQSR